MSELAGLGRLVAQDENDQRYLLPRRPEAAGVTYRYWNVPEVLDQGGTPHCVGFSCWQWLRAGPTVNKPTFSPHDLYHWAQTEDEWPGEAYDGSSVRGGFKAMQKRGYVGEYRWAFDVETVIEHILARGPIVMGTAWYMDMFMPDIRTDYIEPGGQMVGGHAYLLIGANRERVNPINGDVGAVRIVNSWGRGWSEEGRAWLSFRHLGMLIEDWGEACAAMEIKL